MYFKYISGGKYMHSLNLLFLSQINTPDTFYIYENVLSGRTASGTPKVREQESISIMVESLTELCPTIPARCFDGFFYSFIIPNIGKEFDLIKISKDKSKILNIELKSQPVELYRISDQLVKNRHYFKHITSNIYSYTYISSTNELYTLDSKGIFKKVKLSKLKDALFIFDDYIDDNIELLFKARDFLISPINTPLKFINNEYFLTLQQEEHKKRILKDIENRVGYKFINIKGGAGTGKTLLIFDLAKELANKGNTCIVHCGKVTNRHNDMNKLLQDKFKYKLLIIGINELTNKDLPKVLKDYTYILIDETQKTYSNIFNQIASFVKNKNKVCIFAQDPSVISNTIIHGELNKITSQCSNCVYTLSGNIRTNSELASFITALFNIKRIAGRYLYPSVDIVYARNETEAHKIAEYYLYDTQLKYILIELDKHILMSDLPHETTSTIIGTEFDNVIMMLDRKFYYDSKLKLRTKGSVNDLKLLYKGLTRAREHITIIIIDNEQLFTKILKYLK